MEERILINENADNARQEINEAGYLANKINEILIPALKELGLEPSLEYIRDALAKSEKIKRDYEKKVSSELKKFSIPGFRGKYREEGDRIFQDFIQKVEKCRLKGNRAALGYEKGKCVVTEEGKEAIRESHKYYISGEADLERYRRHQAAAEALNHFLEGIEKQQFGHFFELDKDGMIQRNPSILYHLMNEKYNLLHK